MLSQGSQGAAGRAERGTARVGEGSAPDRVVLEGAGLAARAEVRVGRRFHGRHAGVIGVQVGVIHLIHGDQPVQTPGCLSNGEGNFEQRSFGGVFSRLLFYGIERILLKPDRTGLDFQYLQRPLGHLSKTPVSFVVSAVSHCHAAVFRLFVSFSFWGEIIQMFSLFSPQLRSPSASPVPGFLSLSVTSVLLPGLQFAPLSRSV